MKLDLIKQLIAAGIEESEAKKELSILSLEFGESNLEQIENIVNERIKTRKPIQYLIGKAYFMDFEVKVNEKVLIPRPETEILIEKTIEMLHATSLPSNDVITALDIGTGTGIIPIALAKMIPNIEVIGIDVEKEIIDLATENAVLNKVSEKIRFKQCDVFSKCMEGILKTNKFDLIISNPPYVLPVGSLHATALQAELLHEPKIALYGTKENKTGLVYYERIFELVNNMHSPKLMAFEIDPSLIDGLKELMNKFSFRKFEIVKDYGKLDRCLFIRFLIS